MNANQMGLLLFEVSEFERGQVDFVCTSLKFSAGQLLVTTSGGDVTLKSGADRNELYNQLLQRNRTVFEPHQGELPDIDLSDAHTQWVEFLRDLSYGPGDLARKGYGTLVGASTDGRTSQLVIKHAGAEYPFDFAFDGTYPASVVADCISEIIN